MNPIPVPPVEKELLTDAETPLMLGISTRHLWSMARDGKAPRPVKLGASTRWRLADLQAFVTAMPPVE